MERGTQGESRGKLTDGESVDDLSVFDQIKHIAKSHAFEKLNTQDSIMLYIQSWWSKQYSRPLKDPILQSYTYEELLYEYFDTIERESAAKKAVEEDVIGEEDKILDDNLSWAEEEEAKELAELETRKQAQIELEKNKEWVEEQLKKEKDRLGLEDDFGEDLKFEE